MANRFELHHSKGPPSLVQRLNHVEPIPQIIYPDKFMKIIRYKPLYISTIDMKRTDFNPKYPDSYKLVIQVNFTIIPTFYPLYPPI